MEERQIRIEIVREVVASIKEKASAHDDAKANAQRAGGKRAKQNWDCSQIENEEEKEEDVREKENQVEVQWDEDH